MQYTFYLFLLIGVLWFLRVSIFRKNKSGILSTLGVIGLILIVGIVGGIISVFYGLIGLLVTGVLGLVISILKIKSRIIVQRIKRKAIAKGELVFVYPNKSDLKELTKALHKYTSKNGAFNSNPIIGYHIDNTSPSFYLGLSKFDSSKSEDVLKMIETYFYQHIKFTIINLEERSELITKLKEQGLKITMAYK